MRMGTRAGEYAERRCECSLDNAALLNGAGCGQYGYTPLHWACLDNFEEAVVLLLDAKAEVDKEEGVSATSAVP